MALIGIYWQMPTQLRRWQMLPVALYLACTMARPSTLCKQAQPYWGCTIAVY